MKLSSLSYSISPKNPGENYSTDVWVTNGVDSFRTIFLSEKTTPKISFASSWTLSRPFLIELSVSVICLPPADTLLSGTGDVVEAEVVGRRAAAALSRSCHCLT